MRDIESVTVYVELPTGNKIESFNITAQSTAADITDDLETEHNEAERRRHWEEVTKRGRRRTTNIVGPIQSVDLTLTAHGSEDSVTFRPTDKILAKLQQTFGRERTIPLLVVEYKIRSTARQPTRPSFKPPSPSPAERHTYGHGQGNLHGGAVAM